MRGFGDYSDDDTASAIKARDWKDATDLIVGPLKARGHKGVNTEEAANNHLLVEEQPILIDRSAFNQGVNAQYDTHISDDPVTPSLVARGPHAVATASHRIANTLRVGSGVGERGDGTDNLVTAIVMRQREGKPGGGKGPLLSEDKSLTLAAAGNDQTLFVAPIGFSHTQGLSAQPSEAAWPTLRTEGNGMAVNTDMSVRRLTPLECERLMGWPDNWTAGQADTHRYKQCGNGVASPVAQWIGEQILNIPQ